VKLNRLVPVLLAAALSLTATASNAEGLRFFPGFQSGFKFEPTLAVSAGVVNVTDVDDHDADFVYGLDFNFNCLLMQTPENHMRTHLQVNHTDNSGLKSTSVELSPRYTLPVGAGFAFGVGPVVALVLADNGVADNSLFGYGLVGGLEYRKGILYSGIDLRYMNTTESDDVGFENWALLAKLGINF
jgi:hypothetical protein